MTDSISSTLLILILLVILVALLAIVAVVTLAVIAFLRAHNCQRLCTIDGENVQRKSTSPEIAANSLAEKPVEKPVKTETRAEAETKTENPTSAPEPIGEALPEEPPKDACERCGGAIGVDPIRCVVGEANTRFVYRCTRCSYEIERQNDSVTP